MSKFITSANRQIGDRRSGEICAVVERLDHHHVGDDLVFIADSEIYLHRNVDRFIERITSPNGSRCTTVVNYSLNLWRRLVFVGFRSTASPAARFSPTKPNTQFAQAIH